MSHSYPLPIHTKLFVSRTWSALRIFCPELSLALQGEAAHRGGAHPEQPLQAL